MLIIFTKEPILDYIFATAEKGSSPERRHASILYCSTSSYGICSTCLARSLLNWRIKSIQKRALRIIFGGNSFTISSYHSFCDSLAISSLRDRRDELSIDFFPKIFHPSSCLHYLLPDKRQQPNTQTKESLVVPSAVRTYTKI